MWKEKPNEFSINNSRIHKEIFQQSHCSCSIIIVFLLLNSKPTLIHLTHHRLSAPYLKIVFRFLDQHYIISNSTNMIIIYITLSRNISLCRFSRDTYNTIVVKCNLLCAVVLFTTKIHLSFLKNNGRSGAKVMWKESSRTKFLCPRELILERKNEMAYAGDEDVWYNLWIIAFRLENL